MRKKASSDAVVKADLSSLGSRDRREINVGGKEKVPVDEEAGAGSSDSGH